MYASRLSVSLYSLMCLPLVACGGDDNGGGSATPDAKVYMDAAIDAPVACTAPTSLANASLGTMQMPAVGNWITKNTQDNTISFALAVSQSMADTWRLRIIVPRPMGGFTPTTYNFDPNPTSQTPTAIAALLSNINPSTMMAEKALYATGGSITFTAIGQSANAAITGTVSPVTFREINLMTGGDVAGGCTSMLAGLSLNLQQMTAVMGPPTSNNEPAAWQNLVNVADGEFGIVAP